MLAAVSDDGRQLTQSRPGSVSRSGFGVGVGGGLVAKSNCAAQ